MYIYIYIYICIYIYIYIYIYVCACGLVNNSHPTTAWMLCLGLMPRPNAQAPHAHCTNCEIFREENVRAYVSASVLATVLTVMSAGFAGVGSSSFLCGDSEKSEVFGEPTRMIRIIPAKL